MIATSGGVDTECAFLLLGSTTAGTRFAVDFLSPFLPTFSFPRASFLRMALSALTDPDIIRLCQTR